MFPLRPWLAKRLLTASTAFLLPLVGVIIAPGSAYANGCNTAATGNWSNNCTVSEGAYSNYVYVIQQEVNSLDGSCGSLNLDGSFGQATYNGVVCYQKYWQITADGVVGPQTWGEMYSHLTYISRNGDWSYWATCGICSANVRKWVPSGNWYLLYFPTNKWVRMNINAPGT